MCTLYANEPRIAYSSTDVRSHILQYTRPESNIRLRISHTNHSPLHCFTVCVHTFQKYALSFHYPVRTGAKNTVVAGPLATLTWFHRTSNRKKLQDRRRLPSRQAFLLKQKSMREIRRWLLRNPLVWHRRWRYAHLSRNYVHFLTMQFPPLWAIQHNCCTVYLL